MRQRVFDVISNVMGVPRDQVSEATSPDNLEQWDSVRHVNLILAIEQEFGISFTDVDIIGITDTTTLHRALAAKGLKADA